MYIYMPYKLYETRNPDSAIIPSTAANVIIFMDITNNGIIVDGAKPSTKIIKFWDGFYRKYENITDDAGLFCVEKQHQSIRQDEL